MRKPRLFSHDAKGILPRMSWSPHNLYNLIARSTVPFHTADTSFRKTALTMYQQRWRSKRFLRGYHGDHIPERRFKRWFLPTDLPRIEDLKLNGGSSSSSLKSGEVSGEEKMPIAGLFLRDVERRLDVIVHRCCFARSAREGRAMVVQGKVQLNGVKTTDPGTLLNPGDLVSVQPSAVPMLSAELAKLADQRKAAAMATEGETAGEDKPEETSREAAEIAQQDGQEQEAVEQKADDGSEEGKEEPAAESAEAQSSETSGEGEGEGKGKGRAKASAPASEKKEASLPPGVLPFNLPPYASPFLFIPPYLEPSFLTCSAIYLRHPTITPLRRRDRSGENASTSYRTDLPSPYPAGGELFSLAWEHYARNAPRIRSDVRRQRVEARVGRQGMESARQKDEWRKRMAVRRGWDKKSGSIVVLPNGAETRIEASAPAVGKRATGKSSTSGRYVEKGQAKGHSASL